jgi:hypothetical protein
MPALVSSTGLPRIAVLGAGHSGPVIARVAIDAGYRVSIAASGDPEQIELIAQLSRIWSSASATTPSGWTAWAPAASSNPAARSSACRCAGWSSSAPYAQKPPSARDPVPYPQQKEDRT